jgi:limonene-1,2-epoxide hydrolase
MPWVPDFVNAVELARRHSVAEGRSDPVTGYVAALQQGDATALETAWPTVVVHDPRAGLVTGHRQLKAFVRQSGRRLAPYKPEFETIASTAVDGRAVVELLAHMSQKDGTIDWPITVVAEASDNRSVVFRTYCSQFRPEGRPPARSPMLEPRETDLPAVVAGFLDALAAGDVAAAVGAFSPAGYFRASEPGPDTFRGEAALRSFFEEQFDAGSSIRIQPCLVTDDGERCVVEFVCDRWGNRDVSPQPGVGVHERAADGRLAAVRVYHGIESVPDHD